MSKNNTFPILGTERLTLRKLSESDCGEIFQLRSNPEINKFLDRRPSETLDDALNFIKNIVGYEGEDLFYWAITKSGEGKLIGTICLFDFSSDPKKCEVGYELLTEHQGHGIMIEAAKKVIGYAKETLGLEIIEATSHKDNQNSTSVLLKSGFKESGNSNDENPDLVLFRLTKN